MKPYVKNHSEFRLLVTTNGCSENRLDCGRMEAFFSANGWKLTQRIKKADIILFNACGLTNVRENASLKVLESINSQKKASAEVIVWGCFPKINIDRVRSFHGGTIFHNDELGRLEEIFEGKVRSRDVTANHLCNSWELPKYNEATVKRLLKRMNLIKYKLKKFDHTLLSQALKSTSFTDTDSYFIKISTGCLSSCSYCGVRYSRGRLKSKPLSQIVKEFNEGLVKKYKKFTLIGTDIAAYGRDIGTNLANLLEILLKNDVDVKMRLPNMNPKFMIEMMPKLRELIGTEKIELIGAGVQSGNNRILRRMNRGYRIEDYKEVISGLKAECPHLRIRTNVIVGFPSETEDDFQDTIKLIDEIDFNFADLHRYSTRSNTKAATMPKQIPQAVIDKRFSIFREKYLRHLRNNHCLMPAA